MRAAGLLILLLALVLTACSDRAPIENAAGAIPATHSVGEGETRISLRVSDTAITTAGRIAIELTAPVNGEHATLSEEPAFEGWTIIDRQRDPLAGTWLWTLEPFLDGAYTVEPITVMFGEGDDAPRVQTPAVDVVVSSVLAEGDEQLAGFKGVVDAPPADRRWLIAVIAGAVLALLGGGIGLMMMLAARARQLYELRATAHEVALARLDHALADTSGGIDGIIVRISDVVRRYIEDRYAVRAPEQTTEEFLAETRNSVRFHDDDIALLERFLTRADLIKFAGASANTSQTDEASEAVRAFIRSTASPDSHVVLPPDEAARLNTIEIHRVRAGYAFEQAGAAS